MAEQRTFSEVTVRYQLHDTGAHRNMKIYHYNLLKISSTR